MAQVAAAGRPSIFCQEPKALHRVLAQASRNQQSDKQRLTAVGINAFLSIPRLVRHVANCEAHGEFPIFM
jgi:hypothetical protein